MPGYLAPFGILPFITREILALQKNTANLICRVMSMFLKVVDSYAGVVEESHITQQSVHFVYLHNRGMCKKQNDPCK